MPHLRRWFAPRRIALCAVFLLTNGSITACSGGPLLRRAAEYNARGASLLARGDLDSAEANLQVALEYNDRYAEPYNNLGLIALSRGRVRDARLFFRRATALNADFGEAWSNLGLALVRPAGDGDHGDPDAAIAAFREALAVNPELFAPRINLCRTLLALRRYRDALDQSRRATQVQPQDATAQALRAESALALDLDDEAATAVARAERIAPFAPDVLLSSARVHALRGEYDEALSRIERIANDPVRGADARSLRELLRRQMANAAAPR